MFASAPIVALSAFALLASACATRPVHTEDVAKKEPIPRLAVPCEEEGEEVCAKLQKWALECEEGNGPACTALGSWFQFDDEPRAIKYYERACETLNNAIGCYGLSFIFNKRESDPAALARAQRLMDRACKSGAGSLKACSMIGLNYMFGRGGRAKDPARAAGYFRLSCARKEGLACLNLGMMVFDKRIPGTPAQGYAYFKQACDVSVRKGCANAAAVIRKGLVNEPEVVADDYEARACKMGEKDLCTK